ncbi:MAG TPA: response regulator transcription factor [Candidatus Acidoferrales bacterium]
MKLTRVMLADDHTLLIEAYRKLLENNFDVVGGVSDGRALLEMAPILKPEVVLLDIGMPLLNGLDAGRQLKARIPGIKLIFLTMNEDPDLAIEAMRAGASGYLLKVCAASELFLAIQSALKGKTYITPQVARGMEEAFVRDPEAKKCRISVTPRQREVLQLLAEGKSMKQAADVLHVSARTIAFHKYQMMQDLGLKSTAGLIQYAIKSHVVAA